jgi:hypothetical protein
MLLFASGGRGPICPAQCDNREYGNGTYPGDQDG